MLKEKDVNIESLIKTAIHTGIARHLNALLDIINDPAHTDSIDTYSKSKLLEWAIGANLSINGISVLRCIESDKSLLIKRWYEERHFFTSQISTKISQTFSCKAIEGSTMPKIVKQMDICANSCRTDGRQRLLSNVQGLGRK